MIAIVKYNAGNISSVKNALARLNQDAVITDDHKEISQAEKVIFPGVGEASSAMKYLQSRELDELIVSLKQPVLGICLGLQLLCDYSDEGNTEGLGIFNTKVKKFPPEDRVPHIGWNNFNRVTGPFFNGISTKDDVYFVHGYYAEICNQTVAESHYIRSFSAALQHDNFYATQFHPEKSAAIGEQILKNFLAL